MYVARYIYKDANSGKPNTLFDVPVRRWIGNELFFRQLAKASLTEDAFVTGEISRQ